MKAPRFLHCIYAFLARYFWLPCPLCGEMFGGHEEHGHLDGLDGRGKLTCIHCAPRAEEISFEVSVARAKKLYGEKNVRVYKGQIIVPHYS